MYVRPCFVAVVVIIDILVNDSHVIFIANSGSIYYAYTYVVVLLVLVLVNDFQVCFIPRMKPVATSRTRYRDTSEIEQKTTRNEKTHAKKMSFP